MTSDHRAYQYIFEHQWWALKKQIEYARQHSKFYDFWLSKHKVKPSEEWHLEDFLKIPTIDKALVQHHAKDIWCVEKSLIVDYCNTSGTEGIPVTIPLTKKDIERLAHNESLSLQLAGGHADDVFQLTTTVDKRFMAGLAYTLGAHALGAGMVRVGPGLPQLQWQTINEVGTTALIAVPSFIVRMLDYAKVHGIDVNATSVKKAICIGEPIRHADFTLNTLGQKIASQWDIQLYSTYASSEMATAFTECEAGMGGHLLNDLVVLEVLDDAGAHVNNGEQGEVTITTLGVEGFPMIRFRTGDICTFHFETCQCGRHGPRLGPVLGRKNQMIKTKGTTCYPQAIFDAVASIEGIDLFQVVLSKDEFNNDVVRILFASQVPIEKRTLINHFKSTIRFTPILERVSQEKLKTFIFDPSSRKPKRLVDLR